MPNSWWENSEKL